MAMDFRGRTAPMLPNAPPTSPPKFLGPRFDLDLETKARLQSLTQVYETGWTEEHKGSVALLTSFAVDRAQRLAMISYYVAVAPLAAQIMARLPPPMQHALLFSQNQALRLFHDQDVRGASQQVWIMKTWPIWSVRNFLISVSAAVSVFALLSVLMASLFVGFVSYGLLVFLSVLVVKALVGNSGSSRRTGRGGSHTRYASEGPTSPHGFRRVETVYTSPSVSSRQSSPDRRET